MRGSFALVMLFALGSAGFAPAQTAPKVDLKKDTADAFKVGNKTLDQCIKEFNHKDVSKREAAIRHVVLFPPEVAAKAIPALRDQIVKLGSSGDLSVRTSVCTVLAEIFRTNEKIDPALAQSVARVLGPCLHDPQVVMKYRAAQTLATIGPEAKIAIGELMALLKDQASWELRQTAAQALGNIAYDKTTGVNIQVLQALYGALYDSVFRVRLASIQSLTYLGPPPGQNGTAAYVKSLEAVARTDPEPAIQIWARCAVAHATSDYSEAMLAPISKLMKSTDPVIRIQAVQAMGTLGPKGQKALTSIIPCLEDSDNGVKLIAIWAVGQMGASSLMAKPKLQMIIADPKEDETTKHLAKQSLDKINGK